MQWITRERPKIDRIACPWLIARFIDERENTGQLSVLLEVRRWNDGEQITRQKSGQGRHTGPREPGDQISDEAHGDDHGAGRDHGYRYSIDELLVAEPLEVGDHAAI